MKFVEQELARRAGQMKVSVGEIIDAVLSDGCESGVIPSLIYEDDCIAIFERYKDEINAILAQFISEGLAIHEHPKFDKSDPLVLYAPNKVLCLYSCFEAVSAKILVLEEAI